MNKTIKKSLTTEDVLGAVEAFGLELEKAGKADIKARKKELKNLAETLPEEQMEAVTKAMTFGWTPFAVTPEGTVVLNLKRKKMTIRPDGSYTRK